ncbi:hypothetical protein Hanom_Chr08g00726561 [Helianthus anomalus]
MNIITCMVLNRPYNVSKVIFEYMVENVRAGNTEYIMYLRFIMMMIDDLVKDIQKDNDDVLGLRNMTADMISRLAKRPEPRVKRMICRINNPTYVAPENDVWRHDNSNSENENENISEMVEKKTRWWFVKDGKRKRTPKTSLVVRIPTEPTPKIVVKGPLKEPQQRLVDEPVLDPSEIVQQGADLLKHSLESFLKKNEEVAAQKDQSSSIPTESVKETEPEGVARAPLKKKPTKKKKASDEEDTTYTPSVEESKRLRIKRKAIQTGIIPRNVRARKGGATLSKDQGGKKEKHVTTSKVHEAEKVQSVEIPKEPEVKNIEVPEVEITGGRAFTPPLPPPPEIVEIPESSRPKNASFPDLFGDLPHASGKVGELEKEKAKAKAKRDMLKKQVEELTKTNEEIKSVMINQSKKLKKMKNGVHDNSQLFEILSAENVEMREQMRKLQEVNQMLNGLFSDLHETTSNDMKAMKLEMEAMKADKVIKDEQLNMLYTVMECHLNIDVLSVFNNIEIKRAEKRQVERERRLDEEVTQRNKNVIVETQEAGGSSSQADVEMVDVEVEMLVEEEEEEKEDEGMDFWMYQIDNYDPVNDKDDDDQGSSGLLIVNPNVQQKIEDFLNDEINEQEEDHQHESSSSANNKSIRYSSRNQLSFIYMLIMRGR